MMKILKRIFPEIFLTQKEKNLKIFIALNKEKTEIFGKIKNLRSYGVRDTFVSKNIICYFPLSETDDNFKGLVTFYPGTTRWMTYIGHEFNPNKVDPTREVFSKHAKITSRTFLEKEDDYDGKSFEISAKIAMVLLEHHLKKIDNRRYL